MVFANDPTYITDSPKLPYSSGLDGLRAIAVLAVIFYHLQFSLGIGRLLRGRDFHSHFWLSHYIAYFWKITGPTAGST